MIDAIKINGDTWLPVANIRFAKDMSDEDRARMGERYGRDASQFQTQFKMSDGSSRAVRETRAQLEAQGLALYDLGDGRFLPAQNVVQAKELTAEGREALRGKGLNVNDAFTASVDTVAGLVLTAKSARDVAVQADAAKRQAARVVNAPANENDAEAAPAAHAE